jgi:hypothetical protein
MFKRLSTPKVMAKPRYIAQEVSIGIQEDEQKHPLEIEQIPKVQYRLQAEEQIRPLDIVECDVDVFLGNTNYQVDTSTLNVKQRSHAQEVYDKRNELTPELDKYLHEFQSYGVVAFNNITDTHDLSSCFEIIGSNLSPSI